MTSTIPMSARRGGHAVAALLLVVAAPATVRAQPAPKPAPPPYSLPWQLRPVAPVNVIRVDNTLSFYENAATGDGGVTNTTMVLGSLRVWRGLAVLARVGVVRDGPPTPNPDASLPPQSGTSFINPALGATYGLVLPHGIRVAPFLGVTLPIGMGGGDTPDAGAKTARIAGVLNRSAMDNAMFAVDDLTLFPGVGAAWVGRGATVQVEATLLQLFRVRGSADQPDERKTNLTMGLHAGYFFLPRLSAGAELRYQRWLAAPLSVKNDTAGTLDENVTFAVGLRVHIKTRRMVLRPGISYGRGLDDPMSAQSQQIIQLDLPIVFP